MVVLVGETIIVSVFALLFQVYRDPPPPIRVSLLPLHICTDVRDIAGVGRGLTVTVKDADAVHPLEPVTVTEYGVVVLGETITEIVVAALLQA